ncbi:MAG: aldolase/citrate lyase family protein [Candidatus Latescibacterota bacterium]|nr:aldolase/citrate lyase family protein [Candidatus Latescibacterota bacterium]
MPERINRAIELLEQGQPVYYVGTSEVTYDAGREMAGTWADYINVSMEHGTLDLPGLAAFMRGLKDGGPTRSGHATPAVIVDLPPDGSSEAVVRANAWMFKQTLDRGVHGILLCHVEQPGAVEALVEACRYPFHTAGADSGVAQGRRGAGGQGSAAAIWGVPVAEYLARADVWPLNPQGEIMLGLKIENRRALANARETTRVPGIAFAEWGPGDMHMFHGYASAVEPYSEELLAARAQVKAASDEADLFFLDGASKEDVAERIDEGVMIISGRSGEEGARVGRGYTKRAMPV